MPDDLTAAHGAYVARRSRGLAGAPRGRHGAVAQPGWVSLGPGADPRVAARAPDRRGLRGARSDRLAAPSRTSCEEELGDLLLQVVLPCPARGRRRPLRSRRRGRRASSPKLLHRHPHVFGRPMVADADEVVRNWESIKAGEKKREGPFDGIPPAFPRLLLSLQDPEASGGAWVLARGRGSRRVSTDALAADRRTRVARRCAVLVRGPGSVCRGRSRGCPPRSAAGEVPRSLNVRSTALPLLTCAVTGVKELTT